MGLLYAHFDESYNQPNVKTPNDVPVYTVACYLSPAWKWKRFNQKWNEVLTEAGLNGFGFHMNRYENRIKEYADWDDEKRVQVLKGLHKIIGDEIIYGSAFTMDRIAFEEIITEDARQVLAAKSPYAFNAFSCMSEINDWCDKKKYEGPIQYVFAHLDKQGGHLDEFFGRALKNEKLRKALRLNGTWAKGLAKDVPGLQAADILAYEVTKRIADVYGAGEREIRKSLQNMQLVTRGKFNGGYLGREQMVQMIEDFKQGKLRSMFTDSNQSFTVLADVE
ncbi:MAG TPA: hypothetical protein VKD91_06230 [Pyrinomonadaceae bacterium]|nr:hypothetical protein [Pyrinomonadaceae bacterium]